MGGISGTFFCFSVYISLWCIASILSIIVSYFVSLLINLFLHLPCKGALASCISPFFPFMVNEIFVLLGKKKDINVFSMMVIFMISISMVSWNQL